MKLFLSLALLLAISACEPASVDANGVSTGNSLKTSSQLMQDLNTASVAACSESTDCLTAGAGNKSCGGPESYIVFSKWDSAANILDLLDNYNQKRKKENSGSIGACDYLMPSAVACVSNKCKKQTTSADSSSLPLSILSGSISLVASTAADAGTISFKADGSTTTQFLKTADLDVTTKTKIMGYQRSDRSVQISVKIFARVVLVGACEFTASASCSTAVNALDTRAVKFL